MSSRLRTSVFLTEKHMLPVMLPPVRSDLRKCSCPGIPPQESSVTVDGTFDLPTTEMRVGGNGNDGSLPEYASVTLTMKYWFPALGGGLNLFHFRTTRVAFGMLLLTLSLQPCPSGGRIIVRIG